MMGVQTAVYGDDYRAGCLYFTYIDDDFISEGISHFTRDERGKEVPKVSHVGLVVGPGKGIGAHIKKGVQFENLQEYISRADMNIYFKQPKNLVSIDVRPMVDEAVKRIGERYDTKLIAGLAICESLLGRFIDALTKGKFSKKILEKYDNPDAVICSEFVQELLFNYKLSNQKFDNVSPQYLFSAPYIVDVVKPDMVR